MIVFSVTALTPSPALDAAVQRTYPNDSLKLSATAWLIASNGTAQELSNRLGVTDGALGSTLVFATSGYFGRAPSNIWEWVKAKLEAPVVA